MYINNMLVYHTFKLAVRPAVSPIYVASLALSFHGQAHCILWLSH